MVADGLNMVETYIFWNLHEFKRGQVYDFSGNANWTLFVEKAAQAGLFVNLRIGPYVCAEWNYGEMIAMEILEFCVKLKHCNPLHRWATSLVELYC